MMPGSNIPPGAETGVLALIDLIRDPDRFEAAMAERREVLAQTEARLQKAVELEESNRVETQRLTELSAEIDARKLVVESAERELDARKAADLMANESARADLVALRRGIDEDRAKLDAAKTAHEAKVRVDQDALAAREGVVATKEANIQAMKEGAEAALTSATDLEAKWKAKMAAIEAAARA